MDETVNQLPPFNLKQDYQSSKNTQNLFIPPEAFESEVFKSICELIDWNTTDKIMVEQNPALKQYLVELMGSNIDPILMDDMKFMAYIEEVNNMAIEMDKALIFDFTELILSLNSRAMELNDNNEIDQLLKVMFTFKYLVLQFIMFHNQPQYLVQLIKQTK